MKLVSIVVPVYNNEKYISQCINSILSQSYTNFELILVDDGSEDESGKICDDYADKDSRITTFHIENQGSAVARNVGLDHSNGEYISMVDSDDCIPVDYLATLVKTMEQTNSDIVGHLFKAFVDDKELSDFRIPKFSRNSITVFNRDEALSELVFNYSTALNSPCKLYRKKVFEKYRYPKVRKNDDEWAIHHLLINSDRIAFINERIYWYRINKHSQTRNFSLDNFSGVLAQLDRAKTFRKYGFLELSNNAQKKFYYTALIFCNECQKNNLKPEKEIKKIQKDLRKTYKLIRNSFEGTNYSKRDRIAVFLFAFSYKFYEKFIDKFNICIF